MPVSTYNEYIKKEFGDFNTDDFIKAVLQQANIDLGRTPAEIEEVSRLNLDVVKDYIAKGAVASDLEELLIDENMVLEVTDEREIANPKNATSSLAMRTATAVRNGFYPGFQKWNSSGRYGKFFEDVFFGGGGGSAPIADVFLEATGEELELKTWANVKGEMGDVLSVGAINSKSVTELYNNIKHESKEVENRMRADMVSQMIIYKYAKKMQNLLLATIRTGYDLAVNPTKNAWVPIADENGVSTRWERAVQQIYFSKLHFYYYLLLDNLITMVREKITAEQFSDSLTGKKVDL